MYSSITDAICHVIGVREDIESCMTNLAIPSAEGGAQPGELRSIPEASGLGRTFGADPGNISGSETVDPSSNASESGSDNCPALFSCLKTCMDEEDVPENTAAVWINPFHEDLKVVHGSPRFAALGGPSFLALNVAPSANANISCAIDSMVRSSNPGSRTLMK